MTKEKFTGQLEQLVNIPTLSGNTEANARALDLVESWVDKEAKRQRVKNGRAEILLVGRENNLQPEVGYLVHMDVVAGKPDQFKMKVEGDNCIGRGVSDMKFSIPIGVELVNQTLQGAVPTNMTLAITTDEEVGGGEGGKYLAENLKFRPKVLIVPDGGDGFELINKSKGVAHIQIESEGRPAHASVPWKGKNALVPLCQLVNLLLEKYDQNSQEENWETTMNIGFMAGGKSVNQVCPEGILKLDFRFPESRNVTEVVGEVTDLIAKVDPGLKLELKASGDPIYTDTNLPEVQKFLQAAEKILGKKIEIKGEYGASDSRFWAKFNTLIIMTKPEGGDIHSDNEWINTDSCLKFYALMVEYISRLRIG